MYTTQQAASFFFLLTLLVDVTWPIGVAFNTLNKKLSLNTTSNTTVIIFKSFNSTLARTANTAEAKTTAECTLQHEQSVFKCESATRALFCKLALDTTSIASTIASNLKFPSFIAKLKEFAQGLVRDESYRVEIAKYGLCPFRFDLVEMDARYSQRFLVLDYVIPVYGSWNALSLYYEKVSEVFRVGPRDLACYSELIGMLNEASPPLLFFSSTGYVASSRRLNKPNWIKHS